MSPVIESPVVAPADSALGHDAGKMPAIPPARTPALQAGPRTVQRFSRPAEAAASAPPPVALLRREGRHVGPNDRCPCGSGRRYKKCCGRLGAVA
jgi:hypothetical protein